MTQEGEQGMSEDEQELVPEAPPDDEQPMTLRKLQEAVEDESHPRHAEAVQRSEELAEQLKPAMERLRQTVMEQSGMRESLARIQETVAKATTISVPRVDLPKVAAPKFDMPKVDLTNPVIEQQRQAQRSMEEQQKELERATSAIAEARAERQRLDDQRAQQTLDVLASVDAHLAQLNSRIQSVDSQIKDGNASSSKVAGWTILVAVLTLLATIAGIFVTWQLS